MNESKFEELKKVTTSLMQWLADNYNPYATAIITSTTVKIVMEQMALAPTLEFIQD
jgi:hypothetical protein